MSAQMLRLVHPRLICTLTKCLVGIVLHRIVVCYAHLLSIHIFLDHLPQWLLPRGAHTQVKEWYIGFLGHLSIEKSMKAVFVQ